MDEEYAAGLAGCARTTVVVSHDAFGYLRRYGLTFEPVAGLSPDAEPTPADLQHLERLIRTEGITTVFSETLGTSALAARPWPRDTGVVTDTLDPVEGLADAGSHADYLSLMQRQPRSAAPGQRMLSEDRRAAADDDPVARQRLGLDRRPSRGARRRPTGGPASSSRSWGPTGRASRRWSGP